MRLGKNRMYNLFEGGNCGEYGNGSIGRISKSRAAD